MYKLIIRNEDNEIIHEENYDPGEKPADPFPPKSEYRENDPGYSEEAVELLRFADEAGVPLDVQIMDMENNEIVYSSVMSDAGLNR